MHLSRQQKAHQFNYKLSGQPLNGNNGRKLSSNNTE